MSKFVFITGGVVSSLGKGITAASIGLLLSARGLRVALVKLDPYLNVDAGDMDPAQHGEIYVTDDGAQGDLDLGHYERFTGIPVTRRSNVTTGRIYNDLIKRERAGAFKGGTVQVVPHVTDAIKAAFSAPAGKNVDVVIVELGGTVGDIEGLPFIEAFRQFVLDHRDNETFFIHLTLVPHLSPSGEIKTKPTQHSVQKLREYGIQPDMIVCRAAKLLNDDVKRKIARFCSVREPNVIDEPDVDGTVYEVPLMLHARGVDLRICERFGLTTPDPALDEWRATVETMNKCRKNKDCRIRIAVVGRHHDDADVYKSLEEALAHAGAARLLHVEVDRVRSEVVVRDGPEKHLADAAGVIVPDGAGRDGVEGAMAAADWARRQGAPFLGIGQGMHCAVVAFARQVLGVSDATSLEWENLDDHPGEEAVCALLNRCFVTALDGDRQPAALRKPSLRIGRKSCLIERGARARAAYEDAEVANERHRHLYEINPEKVAALAKRGMKASGWYSDGQLAGIVEIPEHPFYLATIAHPEFHSRPLRPHPLFKAFLAAAEAAPRHQARRAGTGGGSGGANSISTAKRR